jgi:hypothetical protein
MKSAKHPKPKPARRCPAAFCPGDPAVGCAADSARHRAPSSRTVRSARSGAWPRLGRLVPGSELLRPLSIVMLETAPLHWRQRSRPFRSRIESECRAQTRRHHGKEGLEPEASAKKMPPVEFFPDQIFWVIALTPESDPEGAVVELRSGGLKLELPKVAKEQPRAAAPS